jgi:hypothetical protein
MAPDIARKSRLKAPSPAPQVGMQLHTADGTRKYLTAGEREAFLRQADLADRPVRTLCMTLAYAGCRLSEALALTADRVDLAAGVLVFESLKKRRTGIFRNVPVPPALLDTLDMVHGIREPHAKRGKGRGGAALAVVADDRVAGGACGDAGGRARRCAGLAQRAAAWFWGGRRHRGHPAQPGTEMARSRPSQHHRRLCQRRRRGGEGHRAAHVELTARQMVLAGCAALRVALYVKPEETRMDTTVEVTLPVDANAAKVLNSPARREAAGRYLSGLLTGGRIRDVLAEAIAEAKREGRASGLMDEDVDAELEAWRSERKA